MSRSRNAFIGVVFLVAASSALGCRRPHEGAGEGAQSAVRDDVKGVGKATVKTAKDVGRATVDLADKAGKDLQDATNKAGANGQDAWITTKVKGALTSAGFDPLRVHVDTDGKVVTLSGSVESPVNVERALGVAKAVNGVVMVKDHLFVMPGQR